MNRKHFLTTLIGPAMAFGFADQSATKQALLMAMNANGKQSMAYQWKQRITVVRKGTPNEPIIEEIRFDAAGQMQRTTLSKPAEKHMGPLKARKVASVKEDVQEVMQLARQYAHPRQIGQAVQKGELWEGPGTVRVQARGLILPMDDMTMNVNSSTFLPARADFRTQHEGGMVFIGIEYSQLPNGPSVMTRMSVQIPQDGIVVNVDSYDFVRLAAPVFP